jgi:hypothetical protein
MPRPHSFRRQVTGLMLAYMVLLAVLWPQARAATSLPLKAVYALLPVVPMCAALWLIAMDILRSDELQQRVHLMALSIATGVVAALSFIAGVLSAMNVVALGGDDLIWVMPALGLTYAAARWLIGRRYGGLGCS